MNPMFEGKSGICMAIQIITDSSADLPANLLHELNIKVVALTVHFEGETMSPDTTPQQFYDRMRSSRTLPKTASPSPHDFQEAVTASDPDSDIIIITISTPLSSTYNHAMTMKQMLLEEGSSRRIAVIDSATASMGLGLTVYRAACAVRDGMAFEPLVSAIKAWSQETQTYFFLDTLENVIKGGRLDRVRGAVASLLNIKLLMRANDEGGLEVLEKVRGTKAALQRIFEKVVEEAKSSKGRILAIAHSNCEQRAIELLERIQNAVSFDEYILSDMGPVIGTYAGEGGIMVAF
jgi:DegV family protein with EDD domain